MGYCISQRNSSFFISSKNITPVIKAIKSITSDGNYSWVSDNFKNCNTIAELFKSWRYTIDYNDDCDIDSISFTGEKSGNCLVLFQAIAKFVKKGSFIEFQGEDGELFRFSFNGKSCKEIYPTISWK
jgi:hypothetical protein